MNAKQGIFVLFLIIGFAHSESFAAPPLPDGVNCRGLHPSPVSKGCEKGKLSKNNAAIQGELPKCSKNVIWSRDWWQVIGQMVGEGANLPRIYQIGLCSGLELKPPVHKFIETGGRMNFYDPVTGDLVYSVHGDILPRF